MLVITNFFTFKITEKQTLKSARKTFERAAISSDVGGYDRFLEFQFKSPEDIAVKYILERQREFDDESENNKEKEKSSEESRNKNLKLL